MKSLYQVLHDYKEYHTQKITTYSHIIGVPIIVFSIIFFLSWFSFSLNNIFNVSFMWLAIFFAAIYYIKLDLQLGLILTFIFIVMGLIAYSIGHLHISKHSVNIFLLTFIGGWLIQFIGHYFESRKPAFLDNLLQIFAAPIFVLAEVLVMFGKRDDLSWINKNG